MRIRLVVVAVVMCLPAELHAQSSRAEAIADQQIEKAKTLTPDEPGPVETWVVRTKNELLVTPSGFFPTFDSVYPGGGFTVGLGYRRYYADRTFWSAHGSYSVYGYKHVQVSTTSYGWLENRLTVGAHAGWRDATQVLYFGLGSFTAQDDEANFRLKQTYAGAAASFRPIGWTVLSGALEYEAYSDEEGQGSSPSIERVFTPLTAPGLGASPDYIHVQGTAGIDWRRSPGYSRTGGFYGATMHAYNDRDDQASFNRLDLDAIQHIPILRETWVISLRGRLETTVGDEDLVPYFLVPSLGGGHTLRAYSTARFRDRHALLTSVEWRWIPNLQVLDMAIFYDGGDVAARRRDLDFTGWRHNWGVGARFHGPVATPLRIELARGSEGWHLVFAGSAAF